MTTREIGLYLGHNLVINISINQKATKIHLKTGLVNCSYDILLTLVVINFLMSLYSETAVSASVI